jgi:hypothetical protein
MNNNFCVGDFVILSTEIDDSPLRLMERPVTIETLSDKNTNNIVGYMTGKDIAMIIKTDAKTGQIEIRGDNLRGWSFSVFFKKI